MPMYGSGTTGLGYGFGGNGAGFGFNGRGGDSSRGPGGDRAHATVLSPEAYCFIVDLDSDDQERLEFQLMPDMFADTKAAVYNEIAIIGRSLPLLGYSHSTSRTIGLSIQFAALTRPDKNGGGKYTPSWIRDRVSWLEAKIYPVYSDGFVYPPHRLLLSMAESVGMQVVMTSCSTSWTGPWAVDSYGAQAFRAQVDCQFQEYGANDGTRPYGNNDAREGLHNTFGAKGDSMYFNIPLNLSQPGG